MDTPFMTAGPTGGISTTTTEYTGLVAGANGQSWTTAEANCRTPIAAAGTISNFRARTSTAITSGSIAITLRQGSPGGAMASTAITTTLDSTHQENADTAHTVSVAAGDEFTVQVAPTSPTPTLTSVQFSFVFTSSASGQSFLCSGSAAEVGNGTSALTHYHKFGSFEVTLLTTEPAAQVPWPTTGNMTAIYVTLSAAPGGTESRVFTLRKNGADTGLTVTLSGSTTHASATASIAVAVGDLISISEVISTNAASGLAHLSVRWEPTTDGESILCTTADAALTSTSGIMLPANGARLNSTTDETLAYCIAPCAFTWKKMYVNLSAAPGAAKSRTFTARLGGISQSMSVALTGTGSGAGITAGNDTTNSVAISTSNLIDFTQTVSGASLATGSPGIGTIAYIAPATGGGGTFQDLLLLGSG